MEFTAISCVEPMGKSQCPWRGVSMSSVGSRIPSIINTNGRTAAPGKGARRETLASFVNHTPLGEGTVKRKRKQVSSLGGHLIFDRSVKDNRTVPAPPTFRHREWPEFRPAVQEKGAQRRRQRARRLVPAGRTSSQDQGQDSSARAPKEPQRPLLDFGAFLAHPPPPRPVSPSPRGQCQSVKTALETLMSPPPVTPADSQSRPRQAGSGTDFAS